MSDSGCILSLLMLLQCIWVVPQRKRPLAQRMRIENQQLWSLINHSATLLHSSQSTPSPDKSLWSPSLTKQPTFYKYATNTTTEFPVSWYLRDKHRNSILMICQFRDLGSAFDGHATRELLFASTNQNCYPYLGSNIWISAVVPQTSFHGETSIGVAKCQLFFQATGYQSKHCINLLHDYCETKITKKKKKKTVKTFSS